MMTDELNDLAQRLRALSDGVHDDFSIGAEAADAIEQLIKERNAAFAIFQCECGADEACAQLVALHAEIERLRAELEWVADACYVSGFCSFGRPNGVPAVRHHALAAIDAAPSAGEAQPKERKVGCERDDGLLNIHPESETCEVCGAQGDGREAWRPIESAPSEEGVYHARGFWVYDASSEKPLYFDVRVGYLRNGAFVSNNGDDVHGWDPDDYTHWVPLPEPPAATAAQRGGNGDA